MLSNTLGSTTGRRRKAEPPKPDKENVAPVQINTLSGPFLIELFSLCCLEGNTMFVVNQNLWVCCLDSIK